MFADGPQVQPPQPTPKGEPVAPFIAAALPALIELVPKLGGLFGSGSKTAERNIKAAEVVAEIAKDAIGARNEQELIETIRSDPEAAQTVRRAIEASWFKVEQIGGGVEAARVADSLHTKERPFWIGAAFWVTMALLPMVYLALYAVLFREGFSDDIKAMVIGAIFGGVLTGAITAYWFGTSSGSQRKDDRLLQS